MGPECHRRWGGDINLGVRMARLTTPMHVIDWAKAQKENPELGAAITWLRMDFLKESSWAEHLAKLKQLMGPMKETPDGRVVLRTVDKLTVRRSPVSETPSQGCPRHHQAIHHA